MIKNLYKDIERAKKKEPTAEEEDDEYNTSDEDMCGHRNGTADMDVNLTRGRNRSASPPRRVYEELSDAFGFKKRYFSDDASKSEHHWNRCGARAVSILHLLSYGRLTVSWRLCQAPMLLAGCTRDQKEE